MSALSFVTLPVLFQPDSETSSTLSDCPSSEENQAPLCWDERMALAREAFQTHVCGNGPDSDDDDTISKASSENERIQSLADQYPHAAPVPHKRFDHVREIGRYGREPGRDQLNCHRPGVAPFDKSSYATEWQSLGELSPEDPRDAESERSRPPSEFDRSDAFSDYGSSNSGSSRERWEEEPEDDAFSPLSPPDLT